MADQCCAGKSGKTALNDPRWRRILWFALIINAAMFGVEIVAGVAADSRALQVDALDSEGFLLHYQPVISLQRDTGAVYETFLLLDAGAGELVQPPSFLQIAQEHGLLCEIHSYV